VANEVRPEGGRGVATGVLHAAVVIVHSLALGACQCEERGVLVELVLEALWEVVHAVAGLVIQPARKGSGNTQRSLFVDALLQDPPSLQQLPPGTYVR
jgi:hypothetical protein